MPFFYSLKISLLNKSGIKISKLAQMDCSAIEQKLNNLISDIHKKERELNKLIVAMFSNDIDEFDLLLDDIILSFETDEAIKHILIPFLIKAQLGACNSCEFEIDFAITTIRKKLMICIERAPVKRITEKSVLLFLPKGEFFDLILLYYYYLLKCAGYKIMYLGSNIDVRKLEKVIQCKQPDFLITYISINNKKGYKELNQFLIETNTNYPLIIKFDEFKTNHLPDITSLAYNILSNQRVA